MGKVTNNSIPLLKNPRVLAELADTNRKLIELLPLLTNFWLIPSVYPATPEELLSKFAFIKYLLDSMNLPIIDDEIFDMAQNYFEHLNIGE